MPPEIDEELARVAMAYQSQVMANLNHARRRAAESRRLLSLDRDSLEDEAVNLIEVYEGALAHLDAAISSLDAAHLALAPEDDEP